MTLRPRPILPLAFVLLLVALRLPLVTSPFFEDDLHQLAFLSGERVHPFSFRGGWDLFRFFDGDVDAARERIERSALPWRTDPTQKVAFLRPIASSLMWLDHALFGMRSLPAHLHSLLWFVAFVLSVRALYTKLLPRRAAVVALLACLLTPTSLVAIRWWSARNALLAVFFAIWCLSFHLDWCKTGRASRLLASLLCLLAALLSAESALALLAFPVAHAMVGGRRSAARVAAGTLSLVAAGVGFLLVRGALGYGVVGSALYVNPLVDPAAYVRTALPRLPAALGIVFLNDVSQRAWIVIPLLLALGTLVWAVLRRGGETARLAAWLSAGSLLALSVCFASRSSLRPWTMLIPQLGAHAVLGLALANAWWGNSQAWAGAESRRTDRRLRRGLASILAVVCLALPLHRHWTMAVTSMHTDSEEVRSAQFPAAAREALAGATRVVLLDSPYQIRTAGYLRLLHGVAIDDRATVLTASDNPFVRAPHRLTRIGASRLRLSSDGALLRRNDLFRFDREHPLEAGQTIRGGDFSVTVDEASDGIVSAISLTLDLDLDDPRVALLRWNGTVFRRVEPPRPGGTLRWP